MTDRPIRADEVMPLDLLDTPFSINFWISGSCNFRCRYCSHSLPKGDPGREGMIDGFLTMEDFRLIADSMAEFPERINCASFCGIGEPLLNPHLADMIEIINKEKLANVTEVTTNASLLTPEMSDKLIDSGLSCLSVSIQGVSPEGYENICGRRVDISELVSNLDYFRKHRKNTVMVIKTLDICVKTGEEKNRFEQIFRPLADMLNILHTVRMFSGVDYSDLVNEPIDQLTGGKMQTIPYCFLPFSAIHILPDGGISPCPLPRRPFLLGNIKDMSLKEAWRSPVMLKFLLDNATCNRAGYEACRNCEEPNMLASKPTMPPDLADKIRKLMLVN